MLPAGGAGPTSTPCTACTSRSPSRSRGASPVHFQGVGEEQEHQRRGRYRHPVQSREPAGERRSTEDLISDIEKSRGSPGQPEQEPNEHRRPKQRNDELDADQPHIVARNAADQKKRRRAPEEEMRRDRISRPIRLEERSKPHGMVFPACRPREAIEKPSTIPAAAVVSAHDRRVPSRPETICGALPGPISAWGQTTGSCSAGHVAPHNWRPNTGTAFWRRATRNRQPAVSSYPQLRKSRPNGEVS